MHCSSEISDMPLEPENIAARLDSLNDLPADHRIELDGQALFLKTAPDAAMLRAEQEGLRLLAAADAVRVPRSYGVHRFAGRDVLVMEWFDLQRLGPQAAASLGRGLARQHRVTARCHGLERDNFIGLGTQPNRPTRDWAEFFRHYRLEPQLQRLPENLSSLRKSGFRLLENIDRLLAGHAPEPSLLHGDLWGGNAAALADGTPVIFDPAVHYGDRECDLAMSELFGGFPRGFREAYEEEWPLPAGWEQREPLYQLYHVLNHANLFGGGYAAQAERLINYLSNLSG